jgi:hypothetical protein
MLPSFAKFMELYEVLPKLKILIVFGQIYGVMSSFAKIIELCFSFVKIMEICKVLPKIWNYMKFCQKYKIMS